MDKKNVMISDYKNAFINNGDSTSSLMWSDSGNLERMNALIKNLHISNSSVLDYGCGLAHFYEYLLKNFKEFNYTGVDIVDDFVDYNQKKYQKETNTVFYKVDDHSDVKEKYDHIFVSGVFNVLIKENYTQQFEYIKESLLYLFSITNYSLSINFMSTNVDFINEGSYHQNVMEIYNFINRNLSKRIYLDQSYMPYEFTIRVYKSIKINRNIYKRE
ncbi:class I SAM-dependent methyltransferase [Halarcobacter sp.]|uniref:class I SAM-dependent methyltransferase n=1 Tax=Halarcobacter sp. TaxID=2321133 RepID=UPI002AAAD27D|nr:class I SAM-dependent methyltransferase [Halarcobacter sp.]